MSRRVLCVPLLYLMGICLSFCGAGESHACFHSLLLILAHHWFFLVPHTRTPSHTFTHSHQCVFDWIDSLCGGAHPRTFCVQDTLTN
jgi:K+-sensing histidine kinase KdpD